MNELGDEMIRDKRGMRIFPAEKTNKILSKEARKAIGGNRGNVINIHVDARGSNMSAAEREAMENRVVRKIEHVFANMPA